MRNWNPKLRFIVMIILLAVVGYALGYAVGKVFKKEPTHRADTVMPSGGL